MNNKIYVSYEHLYATQVCSILGYPSYKKVHFIHWNSTIHYTRYTGALPDIITLTNNAIKNYIINDDSYYRGGVLIMPRGGEFCLAKVLR